MDVFGKKIDLKLQAGGMHLLARFPGCERCQLGCARHGLRARASGSIEVARGARLRALSFTNMPPQIAREAAVRLKQAIARTRK